MISLLIPCHNAGVFLPRLIGDIRKQTVPFGEVLFFDDGSTDETAEILRASGFGFLGTAPNAGPGAARNRLLAASRCPWVHFHDADDRLRPHFVETFTRRLPSQAIDATWFCGSLRRNESARWEEETRYQSLTPETDWIDYHLNGFIHHNQIVFPRQALLKVGGYNEALISGEDVNLHIRLAAAGMRFNYIDEVLVEQNCGQQGSLSSTTGKTRVLLDTLHSCGQIIPLLQPGYLRFVLPTVKKLAVHFSSLQLQPSMREACRLVKTCAAGARPSNSRTALTRVPSHLHFSAFCELRYQAVAMRNLIKRRRSLSPLQLCDGPHSLGWKGCLKRPAKYPQRHLDPWW